MTWGASAGESDGEVQPGVNISNDRAIASTGGLGTCLTGSLGLNKLRKHSEPGVGWAWIEAVTYGLETPLKLSNVTLDG